MEIKIQHPRIGAIAVLDPDTYSAVAGPAAAFIFEDEYGRLLLVPAGSRLAHRLMMEGDVTFAETENGDHSPAGGH